MESFPGIHDMRVSGRG